jgi:bifunctional NMN adenylyltransferase/nudix hydrolase
MKKITIGYTIGRFNPSHIGHISMTNSMVKDNDFSLILVGSANKQRTKKNPFTYAERAHLLTNLHPNTIVLPLNDFEDEKAWINEVDRKVKETLSILNIENKNVEINLYTGGAHKGEDQSLREMWCKPLGHNVIPVTLDTELSATIIRDHFYKNEMDIIVDMLPKIVYDFLVDFIKHKDFHNIY